MHILINDRPKFTNFSFYVARKFVIYENWLHTKICSCTVSFLSPKRFLRRTAWLGQDSTLTLLQVFSREKEMVSQFLFLIRAARLTLFVLAVDFDFADSVLGCFPFLLVDDRAFTGAFSWSSTMSDFE